MRARWRHLPLLVALALVACAAPATQPPANDGGASSPPRPVAAASNERKPPAATAPSAADPPIVARLHVPHSAVTQTHLPLWIAIEQGYFRQRGLEIETSYVAGGQAIAAVLVSGQAALILSGAAGPLLAAAQGADLVFVGTGSENLAFRLLGGEGVATRDDLRGKGIAVAGRGSTLETAGLLLFDLWGWQRNREARLVNVGSTPNVHQALLSGATEAAIVPDPLALDAERQGYRVLYDLMDLPTAYASSCLITTRAYLARERPIVRAFLEAYVEGAARALADTATAVEVLNRYIPLDDPALTAAAWERGRGEIRVVPRASLAGLETVRRIAAEDNAAVAGFDPAQVVDNSLFDELEQSGFIAATLRANGLSPGR